MKKILICTPNYYTSKYQVGSHNYARAFEKLGYKVAFISSPISLLHFMFVNNESLKTRNEIYKKDGVDVGNIWYYVPKSVITPQNKFILKTSFIFNNWYKFSKNNIINMLEKKGFDSVDILWIESPYYKFMLESIKYKKSIFRIADFSKGFKKTWELYYDKEIEIANKVDTIVYTARDIKEQYTEIKDKSKMIYIPNGIDLDIVDKSNKELPYEYKDIPSPRVIYIGMIDYWFDIDLVCKSALIYPNYSFVIIGDSEIELDKLRQHSNIHILGSKKHSEISKYLSNSDIGIIPFKKNDFVNSINPIKLYEYAAYNLKVVTTKIDELKSLSNLFSISLDEDEFIKSLANSTNQNRIEIMKWIKLQDWEIKIKEILNR